MTRSALEVYKGRTQVTKQNSEFLINFMKENQIGNMYTDKWTVNIPGWGSWGWVYVWQVLLCTFCFWHWTCMGYVPSRKGIYFCWTLTQKFFLREAQNPGAIQWKNKQWSTQPRLNVRLLGGKRHHKHNWSRSDQREENVKLITDRS